MRGWAVIKAGGGKRPRATGLLHYELMGSPRMLTPDFMVEAGLQNEVFSFGKLVRFLDLCQARFNRKAMLS